jgi:hypothetical protein
MSNENLEFLHNSLKYLGFGENNLLNRELDEAFAQGQPGFELETEVSFDGETRISARLFFHRGKEKFSDRYFFNKYEVVLKHPGRPELDVRRMFNIESSRRGVTFKQAYNLLQGRYVQRKVVDQNGDEHDWWIYLEQKIFDKDGYWYMRYVKKQFDLEKALEQYPIKELNDPEARRWMISSLRRGNLHPVTFVHPNGKSEDRLIYANPQTGVIGNIGLATGARHKKNNSLAITEIPEIEHPVDDPFNESILEEEPAKTRKKAHL